MKSVTIGQSDKLDVKSGNILGINLTAHLQHVTLNTAFSGMPLDWSQVILTVELQKKNGTSYTICQDPVLPLVLATMMDTAVFKQASVVGSPEQVIYQVQTAGLDNILKQQAKVRFPEIVNLEPGDNLKVEVNALASCVNSTLVSVPESAVFFDVEEGIGNGFSIPRFRVDTLKGGEQTIPVMGNGIKAMYFINNDKSGITLANQVLQSVNLSADLVNRVEQYDELLSRRYDVFEATAEADARHQCFEFFNADKEKLFTVESINGKVRANNLKATISLNSANVTAAKNWVVTTFLINDPQILDSALKREARHAERNQAQYL
jgi:hypothetical protein